MDYLLIILFSALEVATDFITCAGWRFVVIAFFRAWQHLTDMQFIYFLKILRGHCMNLLIFFSYKCSERSEFMKAALAVYVLNLWLRVYL